MKIVIFNKLLLLLFLGAAFSLSACKIDIQEDKKTETSTKTIGRNATLINGFLADGGNSCASLCWAPIPEEYDVYLGYKKLTQNSVWNAETKKHDITVIVEEEVLPVKLSIEEVAAKGKKIENLENTTANKYIYYAFTLSVYKNGSLIEEQTAETTAFGETENYGTDAEKRQDVWCRLLAPDSIIPQKNNVEGTSWCFQTSGKPEFYIAKIKKMEMPNIYNNISAITKLVEDSGIMNAEVYKKLVAENLKENEEIEWFSVFRSGYHYELYGKIVNKTIKSQGYNETADVHLDTAVEIKNISEAYRAGTTIRTKGFYTAGDGGASLYTISNRPAYTFGSIKTKIGQYANIQLESPNMNIIQLGAGNCFQIKSTIAKEWKKYQKAKKLYDDAIKAGNSTCDEWKTFKASHSNWEAWGMNDDGQRIAEAKTLLKAYRTKDNQEDTSIHISLYIPKGQYRIATAVDASAANYSITGDTVPRHLTMEQYDAFEETFALGDESGSSKFAGSVLYTDNGSGCNHLNIFGPADCTVVEGLTFESRETDSKRTYWYTKDADGNKTQFNFKGIGTLEKTMADEQWYSRQAMISQCQNVTVRNCEFIITKHVRDQARFPSDFNSIKDNLDDFDFDGPEQITEPLGKLWKNNSDYYGYQANPYVEWCDLHTDKQFTNVTFYSGWKNVVLDNSLMVNMAGVFRGANFGYLDFYGEQCYNGTVNNCTMFHNCHDEQIGIFTLTTNAINYRESECVDGVKFTNNRVYSLRDDHVDKIKTRVMVFTVGYDGSKNIKNVDISGNYFYAKNLPSKLFTFGGFYWDNRENIVIRNNTFDMINNTGLIFYDTRDYTKVYDNTINLIAEDSSVTQFGGIVFDARFYNEHREQEFCGNTLNSPLPFNGSFYSCDGKKSHGIANNNTLNINGNCTSSINGARECRNNTFNVQGMAWNFYINSGEMASDIIVDGNVLNTYGDDTSFDYSKNQNEGGYYQTGGRSGFNFASLGGSSTDKRYKVIISNNKVNAPNCTPMNKHFLKVGSDGLQIFATNNHLQKYLYLRNADDKEDGNTRGRDIIFLNNFDYYGNRINKEDWYLNIGLGDSENGLYTYLPESNTYMVEKNFGVYQIPETYDDGSHGRLPVSTVGPAVYKNKMYAPAVTLPNSITEIKEEAFYSSSTPVETLPAGLKYIRKQAFYKCNGMGINTKQWNPKTQHQDYILTIPKSVEIIESKAFCITDRQTVIRCEADSKPEGWADDWFEQYQCNGDDTISFVWGYKPEQNSN